jgi:hypothetical protein
MSKDAKTAQIVELTMTTTVIKSESLSRRLCQHSLFPKFVLFYSSSISYSSSDFALAALTDTCSLVNSPETFSWPHSFANPTRKLALFSSHDLILCFLVLRSSYSLSCWPWLIHLQFTSLRFFNFSWCISSVRIILSAKVTFCMILWSFTVTAAFFNTF